MEYDLDLSAPISAGIVTERVARAIEQNGDALLDHLTRLGGGPVPGMNYLVTLENPEASGGNILHAAKELVLQRIVDDMVGSRGSELRWYRKGRSPKPVSEVPRPDAEIWWFRDPFGTVEFLRENGFVTTSGLTRE